MTFALRWSNQNAFDLEIAAAAARWGVDPALIQGVIARESEFNPLAVNPTDPGQAWGLMQMLPQTARNLGYFGPMEDLLSNPALAIDLGTKLLAQNLARTNGNVADAVSAYNGGFRPELGFGSVLPNGQYGNQAYVDAVLSNATYFQEYAVQQGPQDSEGGTPTPDQGGTFRGDGDTRGLAGRWAPHESLGWKTSFLVVLLGAITGLGTCYALSHRGV